ncbi:MAG: phosphoglucosamine mutase [Alphaproteobacteria bacterium]|nr:phosphoglucosamine mutase [Alphaproteobacteria bacterium]
MKKLFGTDGIRGVANVFPLTIDVCRKLARAVYKKFLSQDLKRKTVLIAKDTRISGDIFEHSLASEFCAMGVDVKLLGVIPTPAVSILTRKFGADLGIMISASHNPYSDNGIKLFNSSGLKLSDEEELELEDSIFNDKENYSVLNDKIGRVSYDFAASKIYQDEIERNFSFDKEVTNKLNIVVDSSNGALSRIAPQVFKFLGFNVISLFDNPSGVNINDNCGVTHPEVLSRAVLNNCADFGIAFDGDGDRVLICDEKGQLLNGEDILAILSLEGNHKEIVSTIMANFGFEKYLNRRGIKLTKTNVGDRHISEYLRYNSADLGGEPSGHIIIKSHAPTGDGLFSGLKTIEMMLRSGKKFSELRLFTPSPSVNKNIRVKDKSIIEKEKIKKVISECEKELDGEGKLIVRPSGTEPLIRLTAEGENLDELKNIVEKISAAIEEA